LVPSSHPAGIFVGVPVGVIGIILAAFLAYYAFYKWQLKTKMKLCTLCLYTFLFFLFFFFLFFFFFFLFFFFLFFFFFFFSHVSRLASRRDYEALSRPSHSSGGLGTDRAEPARLQKTDDKRIRQGFRLALYEMVGSNSSFCHFFHLALIND
jgi:chromate transport protein ChrA